MDRDPLEDYFNGNNPSQHLADFLTLTCSSSALGVLRRDQPARRSLRRSAELESGRNGTLAAMRAQQHFKAATVAVAGSYRRSPASAGDRAKAKTGKPNYG